ncbi:MAG: Gmad2 immunoglobulin-like domain-containing protein [Chloroflexota bacterium]|nr:Gmad2 immunoglobulin-like domain-containing protein [Chloroflexota bacterium]
MFKRRLSLIIVMMMVLTIGVGAVSAQDPSIALTSPVNGETLTSNPVGVTGTTSNAPPGGQVTVTLFSGATVVGSATVAVGETGSFSAAVSVTTTPTDPIGVVRADLMNGGTVVASTQIGVAWVIAAPTATPTSTDLPTTAPTATATATGTQPATTAPTNTPSATATATLTPTATVTGGAPLVVITMPANGANIVSTGLVSVGGTYLNLPVGGTISVAVTINTGSPFVIESIATIGSNGSWQANFGLVAGIPNGTAATIQARIRLGSSIVTTSNTVIVTLVSATGAPILVINQPTVNAIVGIGSAPIPVSGFSANLVGQITVRAVDAFGGVLAQQLVTPNLDGSWATTLQVVTIPAARGSIVALSADRRTITRVDVTYGAGCIIRPDWFIYIIQPGDQLNRIASRTGSTLAELAYGNCIANADLLFVGQQLRVPRQPVITLTPTRRPAVPTTAPIPALTLRIDSPTSGSQISTDSALVVRGSGSNLAGRDLVVRAISIGGRLLAQGNARADSAGNWQVSLGGIVVTETTGATLNAFVRSGSGVVLANTSVNITFQPTGVVPIGGSVQRLLITTPLAGDQLTENGEALIVGTVSGGFDGEIRVRALDPLGTVIDEQVAELRPLNQTGDSVWQTTLTIESLAGTYGTIFAYASSPFGLDPDLTDAASIVYGDDPNQPFLTITDPIPYSVLDTNAPIVISGRGGRLFEGGLVVRILDDEGNVLSEQPTTIDSPSAGIGGEGDWQVTTTLTAAPGTRGTIITFSNSAADGGITAFASVSVFLGSPDTEPDFVAIQSPLPGTLVRPNQALLIAGTADPVGSGSVRIRLSNDVGATLLDQTRPVTVAAGNAVGTWQIAIELRGIAPGTTLTLSAESVAGDGTVLASDRVGIVVGAAAP